MALKNQDFLLTDAQLGKINRYFKERAIGFAKEGKESADSVRVTFEFSAMLGRSVTAFYDSTLVGCKIEDPLDEL
jgi:hypothetical protein